MLLLSALLLFFSTVALAEIDFAQLDPSCPTQYFADPGILSREFDIPTPSPNSPNDYVAINPCGTFLDGCNPPGGDNMCQGPGCCSVCQKWNVGIVNPGSACLGKYVGYQSFPNGSIMFAYTGGDPVPPPGPPQPGPRAATFLVSPGNYNGFSNGTFTFSPPQGPDGAYVYPITAQGPLSLCYMNKIVGNCNTCLSSALNSSCEWCLDTKSCVSTVSTNCRNTLRNPNFCPLPCSSKKNCGDCTNFECIWCNYPTPGCSATTDSQCQYEIQDPQFCPNSKALI